MREPDREPGVHGSAQLQNVSMPIERTNATFQVASAGLVFTPGQIEVQRLAATISGTRTVMQGNMKFPRSCESASCPVSFDLQANEIDFDDINRVLNPAFWSGNRWAALGGRFLGLESYDVSRLLQFDAVGRLSVNRLLMKFVETLS